MYKVKLTPYRSLLGTIFGRQTVGRQLTTRDGKYRFYLDEEIEDPDFWVVQGKGIRHKQTLRVAPENTIFLATEPRSVLVYPQSYINQFGLVCTCQEQTRHPNIHLGPAVLPWFVGYRPNQQGGYDYTLDYDILKNTSMAGKKTKLLSVITSNKSFTQGHIDRINFVEKLKRHFGDSVDVFGRGFNDFDDKWDVISPYKYHVSIENSSQPYYWTEKISDCFLAETFPFYFGCTNLDDYFPSGSFLPIDIRKPESCIAAIESAIANNLYEESVSLLSECKRLVLDKYNMFDYIAGLCDTMDPHAMKKEVTIRPCRSMMNWENFVNYSFKRSYYDMKMRLSRVQL